MNLMLTTQFFPNDSRKIFTPKQLSSTSNREEFLNDEVLMRSKKGEICILDWSLLTKDIHSDRSKREVSVLRLAIHHDCPIVFLMGGLISNSEIFIPSRIIEQYEYIPRQPTLRYCLTNIELMGWAARKNDEGQFLRKAAAVFGSKEAFEATCHYNLMRGRDAFYGIWRFDHLEEIYRADHFDFLAPDWTLDEMIEWLKWYGSTDKAIFEWTELGVISEAFNRGYRGWIDSLEKIATRNSLKVEEK